MRSYIKEQAVEIESAGLDVSELLRAVVKTSVAAKTLRTFVRFVEGRLTNKANAGEGL
jgi:hypothetical protein